METKRLNLRVEIKAVDTAQRIIQGHAAAYSNTDRTGDAIQPGAFDRSLKESGGDVLVFVGHDSSKLPVGEPIEIRSDTHGLYTQTKIYETADGDALLEVAKQRLKSGRTLGMSIGYRTVKERWAGKVRQLLDVDLVEYSFLASPALAANPQATVVGTKARKAQKATGNGPVITTEDSYEELREDLAEAAAILLERSYVSVCATFTDHVIVVGYMDDDQHYWDIPYTLDTDGDPVLGEASEVDPAFVPAAVKARAQLQEEPSVKVMTAEMKAALPDGAFAFIADGGTLDEEKKTVPRASRHYPHHDDKGHVDLDALKGSFEEALAAGEHVDAIAHLHRHLMAAEHSGVDDAHTKQWSGGAAARLLVASLKLARLAESVAADRTAMERLGIDTKSGGRINAATRMQIKAVHSSIGYLQENADSIERGDDGTAQVDVFRSAFELLTLEEVA